MHQSNLHRGKTMLGICFAWTLCLANLSATVIQVPESENAVTSTTVRGKGYVESQKTVSLRNETGTESTIIGIAADQSVVHKGDLVIQLDDSLLQDKLAQQEIIVAQSKVQTEQAKAELDLLKREYDSARKLATEKRDVAAMKYEMLLGREGELDLEINRTRDKLQLARKEREIVELRQQSDQNPDAADDAEANETSFNASTVHANIRHLAAHLEFLEGPQKAYYSALLKLEIWQPDVELELATARFEVAETKHARALLENQTQLQFDVERLKQIRTQIAACEIRAPEDGYFVCAHHLYGRQSDELDPIEEGRSVRDFETIAFLPDMSQLQIKITVSEELISRVQLDQPASIKSDSFIGRTFKGIVAEVGRFPEPTSWRDKTKKYSVVVALKERPEQISWGTSAIVEIDTTGAQK